MLFEKCDTPCGTFGPKPRIILRKNIFYYMIELPYVNGKRRFFRKSLHTDNYFEARQIVKMWIAQGLNMRTPNFPVFEYPSDRQMYDMKKQANAIYKSGNLWPEIHRLLESVHFDTPNIRMCAVSKLDPIQSFELSKSNDPKTVDLQLYICYTKTHKNTTYLGTKIFVLCLHDVFAVILACVAIFLSKISQLFCVACGDIEYNNKPDFLVLSSQE